ncbi:MAG: YARHG domain-containing protein [Acidobacteriota bacterium]
MPNRLKRILRAGLFATCIITLLSGFTWQKFANLDRWEKFDFAKQIIKPEQIQPLTLKELSLLRGIVFGKHGRIFREPDISDYLYSRQWYEPTDEFKNSLLNDTERKNIDLIRETESKKHMKVEPGDLRFYRDRIITREMLGKHSLAELHVMRAEIEAIHGKRFDDEPTLQTYFEERYWYTSAEKYDPKTLSEIERRNMALIAAATKEQRNLKLSPGDMAYFQNQALTEDLLKGLSLYELRILRNEIYARRGRQFRTFWIADYFYSQDWYKPMDDFGEPELSAIEKQNIATIVAYENRIHQELGNKVITRDLLEGMFLEDASKLRNEIYARRGKVFKDKWLNKYYASFSWYKANPRFSEAMLTPTEKTNIATIRAYEKQATSLMDMVEG